MSLALEDQGEIVPRRGTTRYRLPEAGARRGRAVVEQPLEQALLAVAELARGLGEVAVLG